MATDLNQCNFIGRLGRDPEVRHMGNGEAVANFSIAVGWKTKEKEGVEWVNLVAYGKLAEICGQYLKKGSRVYVGGRFKTRKWQDKNTGADRYTTEINIDQMQMLDGKQDGAPSGDYDSQPAAEPAPRQRKPDQSTSSFQEFEEDIPF